MPTRLADGLGYGSNPKMESSKPLSHPLLDDSVVPPLPNLGSDLVLG